MAKRTRVEELEQLLGEFVSVQLNDVKMYEKIPELNAMALSPVVEGYFVDVSDNYIYIGTRDADSFDTIITHEMVAILSIIEPGEATVEELIDMPEPGETTH
jgi:hypothetical protein